MRVPSLLLQDSYITEKCLHFQLENHRCEFLLTVAEKCLYFSARESSVRVPTDCCREVSPFFQLENHRCEFLLRIHTFRKVSPFSARESSVRVPSLMLQDSCITEKCPHFQLENHQCEFLLTVAEKCLPFQLENHRCEFLLNLDWMSDLAIGLVLFVFSLTALTGCLVFIVKLLHSLLQVRRIFFFGGGRGKVGNRGKRHLSHFPVCLFSTAYPADPHS